MGIVCNRYCMQSRLSIYQFRNRLPIRGDKSTPKQFWSQPNIVLLDLIKTRRTVIKICTFHNAIVRINRFPGEFHRKKGRMQIGTESGAWTLLFLPLLIRSRAWSCRNFGGGAKSEGRDPFIWFRFFGTVESEFATRLCLSHVHQMLIALHLNRVLKLFHCVRIWWK